MSTTTTKVLVAVAGTAAAVGIAAWFAVIHWRKRSSRPASSTPLPYVAARSTPIIPLVMEVGEVHTCAYCGTSAVIKVVAIAGLRSSSCSAVGDDLKPQHWGKIHFKNLYGTTCFLSTCLAGRKAATISLGNVLVTGDNQVFVREKLVATEGQIIGLCAKCC